MNVSSILSGYNPLQNTQRTRASAASFAETYQSSEMAAYEGGDKVYTIYMPDEDTMDSYVNHTGLSFEIKYAENSTDDNPIALAKGIDENGKEFEKTIYINDVDPRNATAIEIKALYAHLKGGRGGIGKGTPMTGDMKLNDKANFIEQLEDMASMHTKFGDVDFARHKLDNSKMFMDFFYSQTESVLNAQLANGAMIQRLIFER